MVTGVQTCALPIYLALKDYNVEFTLENGEKVICEPFIAGSIMGNKDGKKVLFTKPPEENILHITGIKKDESKIVYATFLCPVNKVSNSVIEEVKYTFNSSNEKHYPVIINWKTGVLDRENYFLADLTAWAEIKN
jgi:hypothetical protein